MPAVPIQGLWPKQHLAIATGNFVEAAKPKALINGDRMGKTFTATNISYRLIKHAHARAVLLPGGIAPTWAPDVKSFNSPAAPGAA